MKQNYIFDIGNVLIEWDPQALVNGLIGHNPDFPPDIVHIPGSKEWEAFDRGHMNMTDLIAAYKSRFPEAYLRLFMESTYSALRPISSGWERLLEAKRADKGIFLLSNMSHEFKQYLVSQFSIFSEVHGAIYSCDVGYIKPEQAIYEALFSTYQIEPETCCLFDDKHENLAAAEQMGVQGYLVCKKSW